MYFHGNFNMKPKRIVCAITGKTYLFNKDYYGKKVQEYNDEEQLLKFFITKKAKTFLERGYSIREIRNMLEVEEGELLDEDSVEMKEIIGFHKLKFNINKRTAKINLIAHKSDSDVIEFINNLRK